MAAAEWVRRRYRQRGIIGKGTDHAGPVRPGRTLAFTLSAVQGSEQEGDLSGLWFTGSYCRGGEKVAWEHEWESQWPA